MIVRTDSKGNNKVEMTAVEIPQDWETSKTEYFVDGFENGDNVWTKVFEAESDAHKFMDGLS